MSIYVRVRNGIKPDPDTGLGGVTEGDLRGTTSDLIDSTAGGVVDLANNHCKVTANDPASMLVKIANGVVYIPNHDFDDSNSDSMKFYEAVLLDIPDVTIDANSSGSTRIDLITVKVNPATVPNEYGSNIATISVVKGTPGAGVPTLPEDSVSLAQIEVINNATTIPTAKITDTRVQIKLKEDFIPDSLDDETLNDPIINRPLVDTPVVRNWNGWEQANETWSFVSSTNGVDLFNVNADVTLKYSPGMKLKYLQDQALTAYWNLDANSNSQVGSFNGTDTNISYANNGKFSKGATFNGASSKIVIADTAALKPTGDFTLGLWFKSSSNAQQMIYQAFSQNAQAAGFVLQFNNGDSIILTQGDNAAAVSTSPKLHANNIYAVNPTALNDNNWHNVVLAERGGWAQIYIDGVLCGSGQVPAPSYAATTYIRMGCYCIAGADSLFFNGMLDDVYFINGYALDEKTIRTKYLAATAQGTGNITITKYGIITNVGAYSAPNTPINVYGGLDYNMANATVSSPYYSTAHIPQGFPFNLRKWAGSLSQLGSQLVSLYEPTTIFIPRQYMHNTYLDSTYDISTTTGWGTPYNIQNLVGKRATRVKLYIEMNGSDVRCSLALARNGMFNTTAPNPSNLNNDWRVKGLKSLVAGNGDAPNTVELEVDLDSAQLLGSQANAYGGSFPAFRIQVAGWYEPVPTL